MTNLLMEKCFKVGMTILENRASEINNLIYNFYKQVLFKAHNNN